MAGARDWSTFVLVSHWMLDASVDDVVDVLGEPLSLTRWWPAVFMKAELIEPGGPNLTGLRARLFTKGLLPHTFQFTAEIVNAERRGELDIRTWGDFDGRGTIRMREVADGVSVTIRWEVDVHQPFIRPLLWILKPIFAANHRWAMRRGHEGLVGEIRRRKRGATEAVTHRWQRPAFPHNLPAFQRVRWNRDAVRWND